MALQNPYPSTVCRSRHSWDVPRNNRLIKNFLDSDCDVFVKLDIDQVYPHNFFTGLVPLIQEYKVIGPMIYDRWEAGGFQPLAFTEYSVNCKHKPMDLTGLRGVVEIPYPHTNMFYAREVLESLDPPWYEIGLASNGVDKDRHIDYYFIDKIHKAGYKTYINLDIVVEHIALVRCNERTHKAMTQAWEVSN